MPRKTNKVKSIRTVLIVVEGQTERFYFSEINSIERIPGITVLPKESSHSDIKHVLETALIENETGVYDSVWCVFDRDTFLQDNAEGKLTSLLRKTESKGISIADSMPSFEIWFLSHYKKPASHYSNQNAVIDELLEFIPDYCKERKWLERKNLYKFLKERQGKAMENCSRLRESSSNFGNDCSFCNVDKLIMELIGHSR